MDKLLTLLADNARLSLEQLASLTGMTEQEVAERMDGYEKEGVIAGYRTVINWEKAGSDLISGVIELRISPKRDFGFDECARAIASLPEVENLYLMSGGYDLSITIHGKSFKDIALFVARRLSPMESVLSTATHFVLKVYKQNNIMFSDSDRDERGFASL